MRLKDRVILINRKRTRIVEIDRDGHVVDYGYLDRQGRPCWRGKRQPYNPEDYCHSSE
jgi:hypothetical protein